MRSTPLAGVAVLACLCVVACPTPRDTTPIIHVRPGAAQWMNYLARPAEPAGAHPAARVHVMKDGQQLGGPCALGRPGDLLLENDEVVFVVDQLGASAGFAESGGNVIDAADAHVRRDELGQLFTYFGAFPRQGVYDSMTSGTADDGSAWIEARGRELYEDKVIVTTRYSLRATDRALLVETALRNAGNDAKTFASVGDAIEWGSADKTAPGMPRGFRGPSRGPYVAGVGRFTSYAMTSTEGMVDAVSGSFWTDTSVRGGVGLAPGQKVTYARVFLVGQRPDTASLVGELALAAGQPTGEIEIDLGGRPLPMGETVELRADGSSEALSVAPVTAPAPLVARVPIGRYRASVRSMSTPAAGPVDVQADVRARVHLPVEEPATLEVGCRTPEGSGLPCKFTLEGMGSTVEPDFGSAFAAGPARNQVTTYGPTALVRLAAGAYRVLASRGPEYSLDRADIVLRAGETRSLPLSPSRVVDTGGYLACDFHQHTVLGTDAAVATRDRVIANAAEGVEIAVATEHNVVASLQPIVEQLGLKNELVALAGDELTSDANPHPWGHANAWPLSPEPTRPRGGALALRGLSPRDVFRELRVAAASAGRDVVVQINHPRSGATGYFDLLGFDPSYGAGTAVAYDGTFDALEVWNGHHVGPRARVVEDWRALLRTGHAVTPTANTDTHGIVGQEAGYPRTYVRVADDEHLGAWDASRTADLVRGVKTLRDVVLTNGPMLRVTANGVPIGGIARGRSVTVRVHVECAPWVDVDTVRVVRARDVPQAEAAKRDELRGVKLVTPPGRPGVRTADTSFVLSFDTDDAFFVVASGKTPLSPVVARGDAADAGSGGGTTGADADLLPWAMTGAIWVDQDGDGVTLGRVLE